MEAIGTRGEPLQGYFTAVEWAAMMGTYPQRMRSIIREALAHKVCKRSFDKREIIDGTMRTLSVYAFTVKQEGEKE